MKNELIKISLKEINELDFASLTDICEEIDIACFINEKETDLVIDLNQLLSLHKNPSFEEESETALDIISKYNIKKYAKGGPVEFQDYKGVEIMFEPNYEEYFVNDKLFKSLFAAKKYIDKGNANKAPKRIEDLYRGEMMAKGGKVVKNENIQFPAGYYWVGDICYVLHDEWLEVCDITLPAKDNKYQILNGVFNLKNGTQFALYNTAYGDGNYYDEENFNYGVDSGSIGCVAINNIDVKNLENNLSLGKIIFFDKPFTTGYADDEQQIIDIGGIIINTGDIGEDEDEEEDYIDDDEEYATGGGVEGKYRIILGEEISEYDNLDDLIDDFEDKYTMSEKKKAEIVYGNDLIKSKGQVSIKYATGGGVGYELENYIISGKNFKNKYATDFNGQVAKVIYTKNLDLGSNLGKGSYWNVTQDSLDIYSGKRDEELDSKYGQYFKNTIYKKIDDNLKIFVKDEIADELWDNEKLYNKIKNISDGIYDPSYDDYGLLLFENQYADGGGVEGKYRIILGEEISEYDNLDDLIDDFEDKYTMSEKKKAEIVYGNDLIKSKGQVSIKYATGGGVEEWTNNLKYLTSKKVYFDINSGKIYPKINYKPNMSKGKNIDEFSNKWFDSLNDRDLSTIQIYVNNRKSMAKGGRIDLFEDYENIPNKIKVILDKYSEKYGHGSEMDYKESAKMLKEVQAVGYTFNYGLDNEPYGLRPKGVKISELRDYEDFDDDEDERSKYPLPNFNRKSLKDFDDSNVNYQDWVNNDKDEDEDADEEEGFSSGFGKMAEGGKLEKSDFDSLKKGDKITISYNSVMSGNSQAELTVKSKTRVLKGKSNEQEKICFINTKNKTGVKFYAYRYLKDNYIGFAIGDLAIHNVKILK